MFDLCPLPGEYLLSDRVIPRRNQSQPPIRLTFIPARLARRLRLGQRRFGGHNPQLTPASRSLYTAKHKRYL